MVFDALHKRKAFVDSLGEGLEVFGIVSFMKKFPEEMKPILVCDGQLTPESVIAILRPEIGTTMTRDESRVYSYLVDFIKQCSVKREYDNVMLSLYIVFI